MGYINHHAIIATAWDVKCIKDAHAKAREIFGDTCTEVVVSPINGYATFFIAPDGSKEGWDDSNAGDNRRDHLHAWLKENEGFIDVVEVHYGGDEPDLKGVRNLGAYEDE